MSKTKAVTLSQEFQRAAAGNEEAALAYMLMNAFGVSLATCMATVQQAMAAKDSKIIVMMMAAGVQVRGNVVFVGREYANVRQVYPSLVIEGDRAQKDIFNFSALHVCGHLLAHATDNPLGEKILKKGGDCIFGNYPLDTEAGKINKEVAAGWVRDEVSMVETWLEAIPAGLQEALDKIVDNYAVLSAQFAKKLAPAAAPSATSTPLPATSEKAKKGSGEDTKTTGS